MFLDDVLNYSSHIKHLSTKCAKQTNVIARLSKDLSIESKMKIMNAFLLSNLNYCSTVYHHCCMSDSKKLEQIQRRFLRYVFNDFESSYQNLLERSQKSSLYINRLRLTLEMVFKIMNDQLPPMESTFFTAHETNYSLRRSNTLCKGPFNTMTHGYASLKYQGPKLWNLLPDHVRNAKSLKEFNDCIKIWSPVCECNSCPICILSR